MTIKYLDSKRISALTSDVVNTPTWNDSLPTATGWTFASGSTAGAQNAYAKIESESIRCIDDSNGTGYAVMYDLGSALSNKWVIRFKLTTNITTARTSNQAGVAIGIFSLPVTTTGNTSQDSIAFLDYNDTSSKLYASYTNGQAPSATPNTQIFSTTQSHANGSYWWCEMSRDEGTTTFKIFSDSTYSTLLETETRTTSTTDVSGLRYFGAKGFSFTDATSKVDCSVSGIEVYDTVTSLTNKPTNVQDNSILVEKDTANRYWFDDAFDLSELKAYYKFEEATGNIINQAGVIGSTDSLGTDADLIVSGATHGATGIIGDALDFDGVNDYTNAGTSLTQWQFMYASGCKYTLTMWYKPSVTFDSGGFSNMYANFGSANSEGMYVALDGTASTAGKSKLYITSESNGTRYIDTSIDNFGDDDTNWHLLSVTFDGTASGHSGGSNYRFSHDGGSFTGISTSSQPVGTNNANTPLYFGNDQFVRPFDGIIDETSIWNRILTDAEITTIYNSGTGKTLDTAKSPVWTMEPTYETDFSTSKGWGMSGDKVRVDTTAGKCKFTLLASNGTDRIYQPLSRTLSDKFICEWDFLQTAISASHHYYMVSLTAGTGDPQTSTQNGIMARYTTNTANNRDISAGVKVGAGAFTTKVADDNKADYNNKIYFTMIRNVDNLRLIAYSDSTRTTVISDKNADFTETVTGLNTLILGAGSASSGGTLSAEIDNFKIYDGIISI